MDFLKGILKQHGADLVSKLTGDTGFSAEQAERFVPVAGSAVMDSFKGSAADLDLENPSSPGNVQALMGDIDTASLASKAGISPDLGLAGLKALLPTLLGLLGAKAGGLGGLASLAGGASGAGGMLGKVGGMLGK